MKRLVLTLACVAVFSLGALLPQAGRTVMVPSLLLQLFAGVPLQATYFPAAIKSLQQVDISFSASTSGTATLSPSITASKALLVYQGDLSGDNSSGSVTASTWAYAVITNGTTVTATTGTATSATHWYGTVVEFAGNFVKSQGCGAITVATGSGSATAAITAVSTSRTVVVFTGWSQGNSTYVFDGSSQVATQITPRVVLTNSTTITATIATVAVGASRVVGYCYLEFK